MKALTEVTQVYQSTQLTHSITRNLIKLYEINTNPRSPGRVPFKTSQTAAELLKDSKYAVPDSVRIPQETTRRDLVHESLISVAEDLPKDEIKPNMEHINNRHCAQLLKDSRSL